jgi:hypothetical protein
MFSHSFQVVVTTDTPVGNIILTSKETLDERADSLLVLTNIVKIITIAKTNKIYE